MKAHDFEFQGDVASESDVSQGGTNDLRNTSLTTTTDGKMTVRFTRNLVTGDKFDKDAEVGEASDESGIADGWMGMDVGPKSTALFAEAVARSKVRRHAIRCLPS